MGGNASAPLLFLLALVGGFLFTYRCHRFSYQAARVEGQRLLFVAAGWAVLLLIWSRVFLIVAPDYLPTPFVDWVSQKWETLTKPVDGPILAPCLGAFFWGPIFAWLVNRVYGAKRAGAHAIESYGSELEKIVHRAWTDKLMLSITLTNRKVYVGWPVFTPDPRQSVEDLRLLPAASGYRNENTLRLEFTTEYNPVYRRIERNPHLRLEAEDFEIVFPVDELVSVNLFSPKVEQEWFEPSPQQPETTNGLGFLHTLLILLTVWRITRKPKKG
jgi:hypothetical protein